jgi:nitric oxide reductase subunit B
MYRSLRILIIASLVLLLATLIFGLIASWAFLYPETYNKVLPFYQLRPFHVSSALFWIISGATASLLYYKRGVIGTTRKWNAIAEATFIYLWLLSIISIFTCYALKIFGGREYWEFPPILCIPMLLSWVILFLAYFSQLIRKAGEKPIYVWMWSTGIFFFLITFIEQNLWQIPWFRYTYLREITVQWKANGSMVGAWNQMIYGTSLFLMVKISGDERIAKGKVVFFFYMLGLTNLMFNWGHHIYNVPGASWIRDTSYIISMTEWVFLIRMIQGFKSKLDERKKFRHLIAYRLIIAAEFWVFMNLLLAIAMSIPAINRYTHGTHITVAHAMGTTIGINSMILLASYTYMLDIDRKKSGIRRILGGCYWLAQFSLMAFWLSLVAAGVIKAYGTTVLEKANFQEIMKPVLPTIKAFSLSGIGLLISLGAITVIYIWYAAGFGIEKK